MAYIKQTWDGTVWAKGQGHLQDRLNHMEDGIAAGGGGGGGVGYVALNTGSEFDGNWHSGGTLNNSQIETLEASVLNYLWVNSMHRLDFRYRDDNYGLSTYATEDENKYHAIRIYTTGSNKGHWDYMHGYLQKELTAGYGISISDDKKTISSPGTKVWTEITLSATDILTMASGGELVKNLTTEYDPTNFKNDYFLCKVQQNGVDYGKMVYPVESLTSIRISAESFPNVLTYLAKSLQTVLNEHGFSHNYYRTAVVFAGTTNGPSSQEPGVLRGANVVDGNNVFYIQDVTQQWWERNIEDSGEKYAASSREEMQREDMGGAYVFHVKGTSAEINFLYCMDSKCQAAYWDSTDSKTKWANMEAGKFYAVTFDPATGEGAHGTQRWLVTPTTITGKEGVWATEITSAQKTAWQNTGITFDPDVYAAHYIDDTVIKFSDKVTGWWEEWTSRIISFNDAFGEAREEYLEYIGRPIGYVFDTLSYTKGGQTVIEKDGEHVWSCDVDGVTISLIIPENYDSQGVAHRDTYIMRFDMRNQSSYSPICRHTFTVRPWSEATFTSGDIVARVCFCAVNAQYGDSSIDYLLHSDETGQTTDWILPCSGQVGIATGSGQAVTKWYPAFRVMAGWTTDDSGRCIYVNYFDDNGNTQKVELIRDSDSGLYEVADFRSDILTVKTPYYSK